MNTIKNRIESEILWIKEHSDEIITTISTIMFIATLWFMSIVLLPIK